MMKIKISSWTLIRRHCVAWSNFSWSFWCSILLWKYGTYDKFIDPQTKQNDHEKLLLMQLTYIYEFTKKYQNFHQFASCFCVCWFYRVKVLLWLRLRRWLLRFLLEPLTWFCGIVWLLMKKKTNLIKHTGEKTNNNFHAYHRFIGLGFLAIGAQNIFPFIKSYPLRLKHCQRYNGPKASAFVLKQNITQ